jgi:hypothetical protein
MIGISLTRKTMKQIDSLYKKLVLDQEATDKKAKIDEQVRSKLHKKILEELQKLRKKQHKTDYVSEKYDKIDHEIRSLLLKEIQVILDEYVLAKENNDLKSWQDMYGDVTHYINNFFYYRMDGTYESKKKTLKDYKFLEDE